MIPDDQIVSGLRHAQDRAAGRRLVVARRPEGWRIGYAVPHYGGAQWRAAADPDALLPVVLDLGPPAAIVV